MRKCSIYTCQSSLRLYTGERDRMGDSGRQEFGENALKPFQRTGRVIYVLNSGTLHTPKMITSHQFRGMTVKCQLLPQSKMSSIDKGIKKVTYEKIVGPKSIPGMLLFTRDVLASPG